MLCMGKHGQGLGRRIQCLCVSESEGTSDKAHKCLPQSTLMHTPTQSPCLLPGPERPAPPGSSHGFHSLVCLGGPSPHTFSSVREGREDEEAVFFFADPAHQFMDGTDGRRLGSQGAVAHVELKGACHLEEGGTGWSSRLDNPRGPCPGPQ